MNVRVFRRVLWRGRRGRGYRETSGVAAGLGESPGGGPDRSRCLRSPTATALPTGLAAVASWLPLSWDL